MVEKNLVDLLIKKPLNPLQNRWKKTKKFELLEKPS